MIEVYYYLAVFLFCLGLLGTLIKKDLISILLCVELMLSSVSLFFALFSKSVGMIEGQIQIFFIIIVAAAEAAIGLSLIIALFKKIRSGYSEDILIPSE